MPEGSGGADRSPAALGDRAGSSLPAAGAAAPPPCELVPPPLPLLPLLLPLLPLFPLLPLLPDELLACEPELELPPPPPLEDDPLSWELEPLPLLVEVVLPLLPLFDDEALSCELEPPLLAEEEEPKLLSELPLDALPEPPGCATAGLPPASTSASSAENVTSDTVLLTTTSGTRWS